MYITLYIIVTCLPDSLRTVRDQFLALDPTELTVDLLEKHLLAAETSAVAVGADRGTPRTPFFEGCSPSPLAPSYACAFAVDILGAEDVGAASALSGKRRNSKGKGGKSGGGGSVGGGGVGGGSGGGGGGGGSGGSRGGRGGFGGGDGGSGGGGGGGGGSSGSGGGGSGGSRGGAVQRGGSSSGRRQQQRGRSETPTPQQLRDRAGQTCGKLHTQHRCFSRLDDAWCAEFCDEAECPCWAELLRSGVDIFALDYEAFLAAMYALSVSAEGDCYLCVPPDAGIVADALGPGASALPGTAPAEALHTFTLDSGASRCFFRDSTTLTPLPASVPVRLADPSGGSVLARSCPFLHCPAVPSGSLSGLHLPSFSTNLVSTAALQDAMVTTTTLGGQRVSICTCTRTGRHLATFTRWPRSSLYTLTTEPPQVAASAQVSASGPVAAPCSCRLLSHQTLLWHYRFGPSAPPLVPLATAPTATAATIATTAPECCATKASLRVLASNHEGRPVAFDTWHGDLQLYLLSDIMDSVSLFDHVSGIAPAPPATADDATRSQWLSRDATARVAIRNHLPVAECTHFGQHRTAQALYDALVARYSSPATAVLGRLLLPYLFPALSVFATVADLVTHLHTSDARYRATVLVEFLATNQPPMFITLYFIVSHLPDSLRSARDHFLSLDPTSLTVDLLEQHLLAAETNAVAVGAARGTPRSPFFEGCSPYPLSPSFASAAAADVSVTEDVGGASTSAKRCSSKGKGGRGGGGGSGSGGGSSGCGGGGSGGGGGGSGGGGGGGTGDGSGGSGGGGGGSGGSGDSGGGGTGGGRSGPRRGGPGGGQRQQQKRRSETLSPQQLREWLVQRGMGGGSETCPPVIRTSVRAGQTCGKFHTEHRCFCCLDDAWRDDFGDDVERPRWTDLLRSGVAIFDLDYDAIISAMYALSLSAEGDCYRCVPHDPGIAAAALGASASGTPPGTAPAEALHTFMLGSGASRCFFRDSTTLTPLPAPAPVRLADPSGGPVVACSSTVLPCLAVPSVSLSRLHLPSFSTNLVSTAALYGVMVTTTTPGDQRVSICTCTRTGRHLATFTRRPRSSLYTLATEPPHVAASAQFLVSGLPRSLPPLPPSLAPPCLPCVEGRQRTAPHSSSFPLTIAPLQTLHMDVWGPARISGQGRERYFLLVVDDYTRYTTVFPLRSKGEVPDVLIPWIRTSFMLPDSPQQNGIAERRIGFVMEVARTSMIHAAAPHFLWPFAVRYAAHQLNLWPRVSLPETSPTLRWTGKVCDASAFKIWGSRAFVRDASADKLSARAIPCVFLGFVPDAPGWQFDHPTSRRVLPSQDVTIDESVPFYRLFPYRSAPPPSPPLFLAPGPPPVDPLPPQGPAPSSVSQEDPLFGTAPVQVAVGSGAAPGAASGGAEPGGAGSEGAGSGGAGPVGAELEGVEPGGAESEGAESGDAAPRGAASSGDIGDGGAAVARGVGGTGGTAATGPRGARTSGAGAAGTGGVGCAGAGDPTEPGAVDVGGAGAGGARAGGPGAGGTGAAGVGVGGTGARGAGGAGAGAVDPGAGGAGGTVRLRPYFVPLLQQVLGVPSSTGLPPPFMCPSLDQSQPPL
ncbi:unnamed protein product [Closterium sp. NIES-54]